MVEGKATAEEFADQKKAKRTTLAMACAWMIAGNYASQSANAKNLASKFRYWQRSRFANWALPSIHDWDLIEWRRQVLDEDQAEEGETSARMPNARPKPSSIGSMHSRS